MLNVNLLGPVRLVQAFLPMLRQSAGRIINIGSGEAFLSTPINSAKQALRGIRITVASGSKVTGA